MKNDIQYDYPHIGRILVYSLTPYGFPQLIRTPLRWSVCCTKILSTFKNLSNDTNGLLIKLLVFLWHLKKKFFFKFQVQVTIVLSNKIKMLRQG